jgi:hypothetical protein
MFDKLLHHKLLTEGLEGEGVITEQRVEGAKGQLGVMGFYVGVEGHIKFDDGTEAKFSSRGLDTSKVGDLDVGTIVPVRYDADHRHVALDIPKLEAKKEAKKKAAAEWLERHKAEEIAAADAALAKGNKSGHHDRSAGTKQTHSS